MDDKTKEIIEECVREEENCLYTSTTFYLWLSFLRKLKNYFIAIPLLLGGIASIEIIKQTNEDFIKYIIAFLAFFAGVTPSIFSALKIDSQIEALDKTASMYKIMQGKFRRLKNINSKNSSFEDDFSKTIIELEELKANSLTAPEKYFKRAQEKIKTGDYDFTIDDTKV